MALSPYLVDKADKLARECAFILFSGKCAVCRRPADDPHHISTRGIKAIRWHILNVVPLCRHHHDKQERMPRWFLEWLEENLPDYYEFYLNNHNIKPEVITDDDLRETIEELKALKHHLTTNDPRRYTKWQTKVSHTV